MDKTIKRGDIYYADLNPVLLRNRPLKQHPRKDGARWPSSAAAPRSLFFAYSSSISATPTLPTFRSRYIVRGIYHATTASRHIRMTPPIKPPTMKLSATTPTVPERSKPCGISHTNIRRMPKGMPQHSHT